MKKMLIITGIIIATFSSCTKKVYEKKDPTVVTPGVAKVTVSLSPNTSGPLTIGVSNTSDTQGDTILTFRIKATGSDLEIRKMPIQISSTDANVGQIIDRIKLCRKNVVVASTYGSNSYAVSGGSITTNYSSSTTNAGFIFWDISEQIKKDSTIEYSIVCDYKQMSGNYPSGSTVTASITNADILSLNNFKVRDVNGDDVFGDATHRMGSATGNTHTLRIGSVFVSMGTVQCTNFTNSAGQIVQVKYSIPLTITSPDRDLYIGQTAQYAEVPTGYNAMSLVFNNAIAPTVSDLNCGADIAFSSSDASIEGLGFRLDVGATRHFNVTVVLMTPTTPNTSYRIALKYIRTYDNGNLQNNPINHLLQPESNFKTEFRYIDN
jgi:hypothetical protein